MTAPSTEYEVKFVNVDKDDVRQRLQKLGARCTVPERLMRRVIIDYPDDRLQSKQDSWIRVRDEGNAVTLTYKTVKEYGPEGTTELEVTVSAYDTTIAIFTAAGMEVKSGQETRRETWHFEDVEIVIDEWPFIPPFIEIEGPNTERIKMVATQLGYDWNIARFGTANVIYREVYPKMTESETVGSIPQLNFGTTLPDWLKERQ